MIFTRRFERTVKRYFIRSESKSRKSDLISRLAFFSPSNNFGSTQNKLIEELKNRELLENELQQYKPIPNKNRP